MNDSIVVGHKKSNVCIVLSHKNINDCIIVDHKHVKGRSLFIIDCIDVFKGEEHICY
jgi:hypothetical protein